MCFNKKIDLVRLKNTKSTSRSLIMSLNLYEISETNGIVNHDFLTISSEVSFVFCFKVFVISIKILGAH